jgi:Uma2 family endonuclease
MTMYTRSAERLTPPSRSTPSEQEDGRNGRSLYRFKVKQYHQMIDAAILTEDDPVELIDGWIVEKMPRNAPHDASLTRTARKLIRLVPDEWLVRVQCALTLPTSEPEPDFFIVRGPDILYSRKKPRARDAKVVIEVAASSLPFDRGWKLQLYAAARIPEYWIINVEENRIEVYTEPRGGNRAKYLRQVVYIAGQKLPLNLDGQHIADIPVQDLLPA